MTMRNFFVTALGVLVGFQYAGAAEKKIIRISTDKTDLVLQVAENGRLYQTYLGEKLLHEADLANLDWRVHPASDASVSARGWEVYSGSGNEDFLNQQWALLMLTGMLPLGYIMCLLLQKCGRGYADRYLVA